jgi:hypothetical protein
VIFFERRLMSAAIIAHLDSVLNFPVALAMMPLNAGWDGQPRADGVNFRPYTVVTPMTAGTSEGGWETPQSDWLLPYALSTYGAGPDQTEWQADRARNAFGGMRDQEIALGTGYGDGIILQIWVQSIGTLTRYADNADFGYWGQSDVFSIRLSQI